MSTSWMEKVEAVPMCDSPVTLGRGSMMTNGSRDGSTGAWKYPLSIQVLYHASSTWRGSYVAGRVFVVIARRPPFTTNKNARPIQDGAFAPRYHPCSTPHQRRNASRAVTGATRFAPGRPSPPRRFRRSSSRWISFAGRASGYSSPSLLRGHYSRLRRAVQEARGVMPWWLLFEVDNPPELLHAGGTVQDAGFGRFLDRGHPAGDGRIPQRGGRLVGQDQVPDRVVHPEEFHDTQAAAVTGLVALRAAHRLIEGGVAVLGEPQLCGEFLRDVVRLPARWAQPPHQSLPDGGDQR